MMERRGRFRIPILSDRAAALSRSRAIHLQRFIAIYSLKVRHKWARSCVY